MDKFRYGIIGAGGMGQGHLECIKHIDDIELVAVADPHPPSLTDFEARAEGMNLEYFDNHADLLKLGAVDAVVIATPDYTHVDIVSEALDAGKHVLSEKPAATSHNALARLEEVVSRSDKVYQVGLECRFIRVFQKMSELIAAGALGNPHMIWCHEFRDQFLHKVGDWILFQEKTGGVFVEKTCHYFDLMTWFAGSRPRKVAAFAGQDVVKEIYGVKPDIFDNGWVIIEYENQVRANLGLCMFAPNVSDIVIGVLGDKAGMEGFFAKQEINVIDYATPSRTNHIAKPTAGIDKLSHGGGVYYEHLEFIDCIRTGREPLTGIEAARFSTVVGLAAEESARSGGGVVTL